VPYPAAPPPGYEQVPPGAYPSSSAGWGLYPESSQAVLALVLGLIGVFVFQLVAPFAWVVANREIRGIDAGRREPSNRGLAVAGKILGIIGTILLIIGVVFLVIVIAIFVGAATTSSTADP
jgi:TRAP-type C4-dicarboxylate transport system permease small subunit